MRSIIYLMFHLSIILTVYWSKMCLAQIYPSCFRPDAILFMFSSIFISSNLVHHTWVQIGNAAYHNDLLYEELRRSIPHLANLLQMAEEDKTKANAAGALSNLVRNSDKLCEDIVSKGAVQVSAKLHFFF